MKTADELFANFDLAIKGSADINPYDVLWDIIEDIKKTYKLAIDNLPGFDLYTIWVIQTTLDTTITEYLANHYGQNNARI